jgi:hypothetical protein|nr:MAG TPA: Protein of unknown function (DUF551) [Caudoviricetes sp.]DAZ38587.1 MAG TPA: Protein of unknown function (DUF551) [Caudoviricetes sp.]
MSDKRKIYDYIKKTINPYGRPFEGTAYEFGLKLMDFIENIDGEKANGWIPVSERLPEKNKDVITTVKYSGFMGMYGRWLKTAFIDGYGEWNGECIGGEVIAWMPLPEPYKED